MKDANERDGMTRVLVVDDGLFAMEKILKKEYDVVLLDVDMPRQNGLVTLKQIKEHDPRVIVLIMTAYATIDDAVRAVKEGAYNYLSKPVKAEELAKLGGPL